MASGGGASELPKWASTSNIIMAHSNIELDKTQKFIEDVKVTDIQLEDLTNDNGLSEMRCDGSKATTTSTSNTPTMTDTMSDEYTADPNNDKEEVSSTVSNLSDLSGISMLTDDGDDDDGREWRNPDTWVQTQMEMGTDPRDVLRILFSDPSRIPEVDNITLWKIVLNIMTEPPRRQKLSYVNTVKDVVDLINKSKNIIVLTGAGVSVSCGIPDFRSRDGIYSRLAQDFPDLPDPQAMFDINYFSQDPRPFYKFAREIYPGQFEPSPCHRFIKMLENQNKLLRNYSQNIDTLERVAGIKNLIECHGSFATASCTKCKYQVQSDDIRADVFAQNIPMCPKCQEQSLPSLGESASSDDYKNLVSQGVMKPDIVFFGEGLPDAFHDAMSKDKRTCDLLIVIGSSLKVRPVALIPSSIPASVPQILINRESLSHYEFDVELLGDGDVVINQICHMLEGDFKNVCWRDIILQETPKLLPTNSHSKSDSWKENEDTLVTQDLSQDSEKVENEHYSRKTKSKRHSSEMKDSHEEEEDRSTLDTRPWKKMKSDVESKDIDEDDLNSQITCTKFYSKIAEYYQEKRNVNCDSDSECMSENNLDNQRDSKDDRSQSTEESEGSNRESSDSIGGLNFHNEFTEKRVKNFSLIEGHIEEQNLNSYENSPNSTRKSMTLSSGESPTTSYESSRAAEEIFIPDDCHVVPRIDYLREETTLEGNLDSLKSNDKLDLKPRHASIDSVMDSALGDSCSSSDCQKVKNDADNNEDNKQSQSDEDDDSWQDERCSLASRLPENSYYQLKPGKYIFPGAEVYPNFSWREEVIQISGSRSSKDH